MEDHHGNGTTAAGEAVSASATGQWRAAMESFERQETWDAEGCARVARAFEVALESNGGRFPEAAYMIGVVNERCGDPARARERYEQALSMSDRFCPARAAIGTLDLAAGHPDVAANHFERAIRDDARCTAAYVNLAAIQRDRAQFQEARDNLRRALAIESDYLPAFDQMALLYLEQAQRQNDDAQMLDLAEVVCRQAQLVDRDHAPIYNTWGLIKVRRGDVVEALRMFERAMELDRSMFEALMNFGQITLSFRGYEDARHAFARAIELRPGDYDAHIGLGVALRGLTRLDEAEVEYGRAREIDAARPEAYFNLGVLRQDYASARADDPEPALREAVTFFGEFLTRARGRPGLAETVADVERRCAEPEGGRRARRPRRSDCRPGRLQLIDQMQRDLREVRALQAAEPPPEPAPGEAP